MAQRSGLSKDTLRYYMSLGLLMPERNGAQFDFTDADEEDIQEILHLKRMGFDLREILALLSERRISNGIEPAYIDYMLVQLEAHRRDILAQQARLAESVSLIDEEIRAYQKKKDVLSEPSGIPLHALQYLACPHCYKALQIENASFSGRHLHSGTLLCSCGYHASIVDGVILTGNLYTEEDDHPDLTRGLYHGLCQDFFRLYCKGANTCVDTLKAHGFENKVVLESNINGYFLLYQELKTLPTSNLYIIADKYPEMIYLYKGLIERINPALDVLYIADAGLEYPLRRGCIDIGLDFFAENEYLFYHEEPYIEHILPYLSDKAFNVGVFMGFPPHYRSRTKYEKKYPRISSLQHNFSAIEARYRGAGFAFSSKELGIVRKTHNEYNFSCHIDGDPMHLTFFTGQRNMRKEKNLS